MFGTKYDDLLTPLSAEEFEALDADIRERGQRDPITIDEDRNILDGRARFRILGEAVRYEVLQGMSELEKQSYIIGTNFKRRSLTPEQKAEVRLRMQMLMLELRQENVKHWTQQRLAALFGVSQQTVSAWLTETTDTEGSNSCEIEKPDARVVVPKSQHKEVLDRVLSGDKQSQIAADLGVSQQAVSKILIREATRKQLEEEVAQIKSQPVGDFAKRYDVVVLDPPWPMQRIERDDRPRHVDLYYPTMSEEQLAEFRLPFAPDCHVFCWTTQRFLPMTLRLFDAWSVKYVLTFVWHKPNGYQPFNLPKYNCEFAVYGRIGSPEFCDLKAFNACFNGEQGAHSEKPEEFYEMIRRVTDGDRIDIFNRRKIEGFDTWGNEAQ